MGGARVRIVSKLPADASTATASSAGMVRTRCWVIEEPKRVGVEHLLLDGVHHGRDVVDAVGSQQAPGVLSSRPILSAVGR